MPGRREGRQARLVFDGDFLRRRTVNTTQNETIESVAEGTAGNFHSMVASSKGADDRGYPIGIYQDEEDARGRDNLDQRFKSLSAFHHLYLGIGQFFGDLVKAMYLSRFQSETADFADGMQALVQAGGEHPELILLPQGSWHQFAADFINRPKPEWYQTEGDGHESETGGFVSQPAENRYRTQQGNGLS